MKPIDNAMAETGLFYARFMDDSVVLASSGHRNREPDSCNAEVAGQPATAAYNAGTTCCTGT